MPLRSSVVAAVCVLLAVAHSAAAQGQTDKTLLDPKNQANGCVARFNSIIQRLYTNTNSTALQQCGPRITQAMNATTHDQCPAGETIPIQPGSPTHFCMNQNGTQTYLDEWSSFIRDCEVMYVAFRTGGGESEEGLVSYQNSCFPQFRSYNEFKTWLYNAVPYGGKSQTFNAAGALRPYIAAAFAAAALVLSLVW